MKRILAWLKCLFGYHAWTNRGFRHCARCGKKDWAAEWEWVEKHTEPL